MKKILALALAVVLSLGMTSMVFAATGPEGGNQYKLDTNATIGVDGTPLADVDTLTPGDEIFIAVLKEDGTPVAKKADLTTDKITAIVRASKGGTYLGKPEFVVKNGAVYAKVEIASTYASTKAAALDFTVALAYRNRADKTESDIVTFDGDLKNKSYDEQIGEGIDVYYVENGGMVFEVENNFNKKVSFEFDNDVLFNDVRVYSKQKFYLNLSREANLAVINKFPEANLDFYSFKGNLDSFSSAGTLSIPAEKDSFVYELLTDGALKAVATTYNSTDEAYTFETKELGNYVVSDTKLDLSTQTNEDVEETTEEENTATVGENQNPDTGANAFVNVAVAAGVVALAVAGSIALKK